MKQSFDKKWVRSMVNDLDENMELALMDAIIEKRIKKLEKP